MEDNRKYERYDQSGLLDLKVNIDSKDDPANRRDDTVVCYINNISRSGIGGRALGPLADGEHVVVKRVKLLNCNIKCNIPATVLWTKTFYNKQRVGISLEGEIPHHLQLDRIINATVLKDGRTDNEIHDNLEEIIKTVDESGSHEIPFDVLEKTVFQPTVKPRRSTAELILIWAVENRLLYEYKKIGDVTIVRFYKRNKTGSGD